MPFRSSIPLLAAALLFLTGGLDSAAAQTGSLTVTGVNYKEEGEDPYTLYIRGSEMRMDQPDEDTSIIFRVDGPQPGMLLLDHEAMRVDYLPSSVISQGEGTVSAETVEAYETDGEPLPGMEALAPVPASITVIRGGVAEELPVNLERVGYHYEGDATLPGMDGAEIPANMRDMLRVVLKIESRAAVAPGLEGAEVAAGFYEAMVESGLGPPAGFSSMSSGLMKVNRNISANGFPVWVGSVTQVDVEVERLRRCLESSAA